MDRRETSFVRKEPCPKCGSKDNLARYDDGHGHCFGCSHHEKGDGQIDNVQTKIFQKGLIQPSELIFEALTKRKLQEETCKHWKYGTTTYNGKPCQVATYYGTNGQPVCQKLRFQDKSFKMIGNTKDPPLYGQWLAREGGKMIIVTEGEIDTLSVSQTQNLKWPVVSVPNGAKGALKTIRQEIEFLEKFERVVFMFDMDDPGRDAAMECAEVLSPGKAYIATLPLKDANEMLQSRRGSEITSAAWGAKQFQPDGIVDIDAIIEEAKKPIEWGLPWHLPSLNDATYGRRETEIYALGAGTGAGKTDFLIQQIEYDVNTLNLSVGILFLEQKPAETAKRIAGKAEGKLFHVPDSGWEQEELERALEKLRGRVIFYDSFGQTEWSSIKSKIRYMAVSAGIKVFYVDHLTAMANTSSEKESLEQIMKEMAGLANELSIIITFVSHLTTPEGKSHEEGGRIQTRHFKGSRSISHWSYYMFGLERDQQAESEDDRQTTTLRILKDRYTGQATGITIPLGYDVKSGRSHEQDNPFCSEVNGEENNDF